jgi:two-component system, cell cycle sensor histidine kinase and response regulator CckA
VPKRAYLHVNATAARHGRKRPEDLVGRTMTECYPGIENTEMFARLRDCLERREPAVLENVFTYPDGSTAQFELRVEPVPLGVCVLSVDVTARKDAEAALAVVQERLRHAERMEAIGQLAAGIAHDFNNILGAILGHGERARKRPDGPEAADIDAITSAVRSATGLTQQLVAFASKQALRTEIVDPADILRRLEPMLQRLLEDDVVLSLEVDPDAGWVEVDRSRFEQVVMNIVLNARDALPHGGAIRLGVSPIQLGEDYAREHPGVRAGRYVMISIGDDGIGMDADTRARVFEPYFTTKASGRGTGLGLATVYGIVRQSGGDVWVYSEPGHGTTFKVYFPRLDAPAASAPAPVPARVERAAAVADACSGGGELILVSEDDPMLRGLLEAFLGEAGYRTRVASCGAEALEIAATEGDQIALLLSDVIMPDIGGFELAQRLHRTHPKLRVLFTSGYSSDVLASRQGAPVRYTLVEKPYSIDDLLAEVRRTLDGPPPRPAD